MKIQLKRSNVLLLDKAKEPTAEQMEYGELAVNYNGEDPAVFIKDSNDNIIRIAGSGNISSGDTPSGPDKPSTGNDVGDLFFDTVNNTLYYWNGTEWVPIEANKSENIFVGTLAEVNFYISPQSRPEGFLWWNVDDETLYVWYNNNGSPEWRPATPIDDNDGASVTISDTPPATGDTNIGDLWWDSSDGRLYIYYEDSSSAQWVDASPKGDSIEDAPADGNQYARKDNNWTVVTSSGDGGGGGTGDTIINYNGASAWGDVAADGTLNSGLNSTTTNISTGIYEVTFQTPMPNADYSVTSSTTYSGEASVGILTIKNQTATGFQVDTLSHSGSTANYGFNYSVHALNALPPKGGTGTDAWLTTSDNEGTIGGSFNIASVTKTTTGTYDVVFTTPMPTPNYAVTGSVSLDNTTTYIFKYINKTITGFTALISFPKLSSNTMVLTDLPFSCTVNATDAQLPDTITEDQILAAVNNPGASAWGKIATDGTLDAGLNCNVTRTGTGTYVVAFQTPMPSADYAVNTASYDNGNVVVYVQDITATGFTLISVASSSGSTADYGAMFAVFATNALPPRGGTGTDAWGTVQSTGTVDASFNIKSVTRTAQGVYAVVFTTPMPTPNYSVVGSTAGEAGEDIGFAVVSAPVATKTTDGFTLNTAVMNYGVGEYNAKDTDFNFTVNATDATLPQTITEEQIQAAINNPGASAWAKVDVSAATSNGVAGNIKAGNNITSVTRASGAGFFDVVFTTPMPSADYSIQLVCDYSGISPAVVSTTANGFQFITASAGGVGVDVQEVFITVHATNALPPRGGTGTDSWAQVKADGTVLSSFNATVVKASGNGDYDITFVNPMPTADYAVIATVSGDPNVNYGYSCITNNQTADGFRISVVGDNSSDFTDNDFSFNVNATNATLPTSFTEEEIQAVVDLAKSGSANGATAWGSVQGDGTLNANLNIASVTTTGTGEHDIVFSTPMPTVDYSVVGSTTGDNDYGYFYVKSKSTTGFTVNIRDASNTFTNYGFDFTVHSTNVTLPFTVTQTQIESFKSTVTAIESAVTRINAIEANEIVDDSTDSALLTLIASLTNKVQLLESKIQTIEADHSTLMNNNNGGY